jgi:outer membrane biosynthesis protein TonB
VTGLQVTEPGGRKVILKTGSMKRAVALMRECGNEQLAGWGFDPAVMQRIAYPASSNRSLADLFDSNDYPSRALFMGSEAIVSARLHVGADGKVARCVSLTPYKEPSFGEVVCRNLSRATFQPAKLADGTAVPDMVVANIRFQMNP